ncbi:MAG TPA: hypothetical protein VGE14_12575 [Marmoricola sp.]
MELIEVTLTDFTRRSRSLVVRHQDLDLTRQLEHGERLLVLDAGDYRTAVVVDVDTAPADTEYRLIFGGRVQAPVAQALIAGVDPGEVARRVSVHDLRERIARTSFPGRIPMQREAAERLLTEQ